MSMNMPDEEGQQAEQKEGGMSMSGWKHWGLMLLCCLPMIAIALLLAFGVWSIR
jgi:nitrate reductase NapE component